MKIVLLFLIVSFGFGSSLDYFDKYRRGDNWQKDVDRFLYSDTYIDYLLKDKDVKFGYFDNPTNIIICYKNRKKLDVYGYNNNFYLKTKFENILVGRDGDKWKEGDGKTPIGVYTLKYKIDDKHYALTNRQIGQKGTEEFLRKAVEIVDNINQARYDVWEEVSNGEKGEFTEEQKKMYGEKMKNVKEENPNNFNVTLEERFTRNGEPYFVTSNITYIEPEPEIAKNNIEKEEQTQPQNKHSFDDVEEQNKKIEIDFGKKTKQKPKYLKKKNWKKNKFKK